MSIQAEAWFLYPQEMGAKQQRSRLVRERFEFPDMEEDEVLAAPIYGCWEGNMKHALDGWPVDICRQRGEKRVIIGNSGLVQILEVGSRVTTVKPGQRACVFNAAVRDDWGYPKLIWGYDAPGTMGVMTTRIKCRGHEVLPIPDDTRHPLTRWAAFGKYITAWSNWELAYGTFRLLVHQEELPHPHVWAWGGGTALAELDLAVRMGCKAYMLTSSDKRADVIRRAGVTPIDRRPFGRIDFDEHKVTTDREYRRTYLDAEAAFLREVKQRTDGQMAQIFIDNIGTPVFRATLKALSREGVLTTVGWGGGKLINYMRAAECINRHQLIHTHYARYPQGQAAVAYAEENGWLAEVDEEIYTFDEIPQLDDDFRAGKLGINTLYVVNPEFT